MPQVFIASDHRGFSLKQRLVADLPHHPTISDSHITIVDLGPDHLEPEDDFNDAAIKVSKAILESNSEEPAFGVLICGSSIGVSIQANRFKGIRAAVASDIETIEAARREDDVNVLCLSANRLNHAKDPLETESAYEDLIAHLQSFLNTPFQPEERYIRRIKRLDKEN